jgi:phage-related protein
MAATWARAEVVLEADGSLLPAQTRKFSEEAGEESGKSFTKSFGTALKDLTKKVSPSLDEFKKSFRSKFTNFMKNDVRSALTNVGNRFKKFFKDLDTQGGGWNNMTAQARRWVLIIGSIVGALPQASALGSAFGGTIVALATDFTAAAAGAGVLYVAFTGLFSANAKLSKGAQASKEAFMGLEKAFQDLQGQITNAVFDNMADSINRITKNLLPALNKQIIKFSKSVGEDLGDAFDALSSPLAIKNFRKLLNGFGPILKQLTKAAIGFGSAIGGILVASLPAATKFAKAIADAGTAFGTWANSTAGQKRLSEFFQTAETVMPHVVSLVVAAGKALADLVTPATIKSLDDLLDGVAQFMPVLSGLLGVVGATNPFGLIAQALDDLGSAITPLIGPLTDLAGSLSAVVSIAIARWGQDIGGVAKSLAPFVSSLADMIAKIPPSVINQFADALLTFAAAALVLKGAKGIAGLGKSLVSNLSPLLGLASLITLLQSAGPALSNAATFATVIGTIGGAAGTAATAFGYLAGIIGASVGLFATVAGAVAAFVAEIVLEFSNPAGMAQAFTTFFNGFFGQFTHLPDNITQILGITNDSFYSGFGDILGTIGDFFTTVIGKFALGWTQIEDFFNGFINTIVTGWNGFWAGLAIIVQTAWSGIAGLFSSIGAGIAIAWNNFWGGLGGIVSSVWGGITSTVQTSVNFVIGLINGMIKSINGALGAIKNLTGGLVNLHIPTIPKTASGAVVNGAQTRIIGEAGPEAVVPLNRPLSQVDPSVRWLSALAQGKTPAMGSGGVVGGGRTVQIEDGAITIVGVTDPAAVAYTVLDRVAARVNA